MKETEIKLNKEEYKTLLTFLAFADYGASTGLFSEFKEVADRNRLFDVLTKVHAAGDAFDLPKNLSFTSLTAETRLPEEEHLALKKKIEDDLDDIANRVFARELAKRDLKPILMDENVHTMHTETHSEINQRWIHKAAKKYLKEFREHGVENLKFKMFYSVPDVDEDEEE